MNSESPCIMVGLPAYNEELNLPFLFEEIRELQLPNYIILLVDDGSSDNTAELVKDWTDKIPLVVVRHPENQGLGAAVKNLLREAAARLGPDDYLVLMDADRSHRPYQIPSMLEKASEGYDLVIASRYTSQSKVVGVPLFRRMLSHGAYLFVRTLFGLAPIKDFTCGYRAISMRLLQKAEEKFPEGLATENGFSVTLEVLVKLVSAGAKPAEIGMDLRYDLKAGGSKMRPFATILQYFGLFGRLKKDARRMR
jgi:dolichol-phosphate mannosyltransferase